jgi:hypothetical protein
VAEVRPDPVDKFAWQDLFWKAWPNSPMFAHDERCPRSCTRGDGRRLRPATIKAVAYALLVKADLDGTKAHPGLRRLAVATGLHRSTVSAVLGHLEAKGLVHAVVRASARDIERHWATEYWLTFPGDVTDVRELWGEPVAEHDEDQVLDDEVDDPGAGGQLEERPPVSVPAARAAPRHAAPVLADPYAAEQPPPPSWWFTPAPKVLQRAGP